MSDERDDLLKLVALFKDLDRERARYALILDKFVFMDETTVWGRRQLEANADRTVFAMLAAWDAEAARLNGDSDFVSHALIAHKNLSIIYDATGDLTSKLKDLLDFEASDGSSPADFLSGLNVTTQSDTLNTGDLSNDINKVVVTSNLDSKSVLPLPLPIPSQGERLTQREILLNFLKEHKDQRFRYDEVANSLGLKTKPVSAVLCKMLKRKEIRRIKGCYFYEDEVKITKQKVDDELNPEEDKSAHPQPQGDEK